MELQNEIKKENQIVSDWLLHYHDRLAEYEQHKSEIAVYPGQALSDEIRAEGISDPTHRAALKMQGFKYNPEWFLLVEELERRIPEKQRIFLQVRREARNNHSNYRGRPGWVAYVQCKYPLVMAERTGKDIEKFYIGHPNTYTGWWNRLVEAAVRMAIERRLIRKKY